MAFDTLMLDVDTQWDLVDPTGAWPVHGALLCSPRFERLKRYAKMYNIPVLSTVQSRSESDAAFESNGGSEPVHCVAGTPGQAKIAATDPENPVTVENKAIAEGELASLIKGRREIIVETSGPDFMSNPNAGALVKGTKTAVVFGVTADGAVMKAVQLLLDQGVSVEVVYNAVAVRSEEEGDLDKVLDEMVTLGARKIRDMDIMTRFTTDRHR